MRIYFFSQMVEMSALCFLQTKLNVKSVHFIRISVRPVTSKMYYILLATSVLFTAFTVRSPKKPQKCKQAL